jgi:lipopolysaccharide export system protein LptA
MTTFSRALAAPLSRLAVASLALAIVTAPALAVGAPTNPTMFKGFGNSKDPIQIEADNVSVATPDQIVTFTGNVNVKQKDSTLTTHELKVFYDNTPPTPGAAPPPAAGAPNAQLRRFEASGGLKITEPDQTVTGDSGWFDMTSQKAEVDGNVVLTHAKDVARAAKLLINLVTGQYKLEGGGNTGRVIMLLNPGDNQTPAPAKPK